MCNDSLILPNSGPAHCSQAQEVPYVVDMIYCTRHTLMVAGINCIPRPYTVEGPLGLVTEKAI